MRSFAAMFLLFALSVPAVAAPKATQVTYANGIVTIDIFIELFGDGASTALASEWESLIESHWNDAFREHGCDCFQIVVDAHVEHNASANSAADATPGWEAWEVNPRDTWEAGDPEWTPHVYFPDGLVENSDRFEGEAGSGQLATDEPWVVVHEAGHLIGQDEGYDFPEGWEKGDSVEPKSGYDADNIMAGPKIEPADWAADPSKYFSAINYEEVQKSVLDYLKEHGANAPRGVAEMQLSLDFFHNAWGPAGPGVKNSEKAHVEIDLCVLFFATGGETSSSPGSMNWSAVSRVPGTWYGGNRTVYNPFPVTATGSVVYEHGFGTYFLELDPHDMVSNYLNTGSVYATGGHLWYAFENSRFTMPGVKGNLKKLELSPLTLAFDGLEAPFTIESPVNQNVQTVGEGILKFERSVLID